MSVDWITESIKKGYALPHSLYTIKKGTSTPTKENESDPNFSTISAIVDNNVTKYSTLEESVIPKKVQMSVLNFRMSPVKRKSTPKFSFFPHIIFRVLGMEEVEKIIDGLDIKKAKKSGQYLDGCNVSICIEFFMIYKRSRKNFLISHSYILEANTNRFNIKYFYLSCIV